MARRVDVYTGYTARSAFEPFHNRTEREAVMVCHRRAGKTVAICNDAQERCLMLKRAFPPARIAWFYPTRVRAKDIAWPYLKHYSRNIPGARPIESELAIEYPNMGRVTLYGADNSRGVGLWLDGAYYDEGDEIPQKVVSEVAPTLSDYGGFSVYAGMLKGRHNLHKRFEAAKVAGGVFTLMMRASQSGIISQPELVQLRATMGEAAYEMQLECNVNASIANAIYGKEMDAMRKEGRLGKLALDRTVPLDFFFDIGHSMMGDDWSYWGIQLKGRDVLFQRYLARTGEIPAFYAAQLLREWDEAGMGQGTVYLPHDGTRKDRHGRSAEDDLREAGIKRIKIVPRTPNLWDSINQFRALLPRVYIDQEHCGEGWTLGESEMPSGVDCLDYYCKKIEAQTGMILEVPVHNQYSHGADAARTFAEAQRLNMLESMSDYGAQRNNITASREPMDTPRRHHRITSRR